MASARTPSPLPAELRAFLDLFHNGAYWESHEALEGVWRATRSDFYQGLILYASAWVHWERDNAHGVQAQLGKALERLDGYASPYLGVDVQSIRDRCEATRRMVSTHPDDWRARTRPAPLQVDAAAVRGDEPELVASE